MNKLFYGSVALLCLLFAGIVLFPISDPPKTSGVMQKAKNHDYSLATISKPADSSQAKSFLAPRTLSQLFGSPKRAEPTPGPDSKENNAPVMQEAVWLSFLGTIQDSLGIERYYLKDKRSGDLIRVRKDSTEEKGYQLKKSVDGKSILSTPQGEFILNGDFK